MEPMLLTEVTSIRAAADEVDINPCGA
jgi:hypothetical protein